MKNEKINKVIAIQLIIATVVIVVLCYFIYIQQKEIQDLETVLDQCENAYYKKVFDE